jgi:DNA-binding transcriptional LysR family regulator
MVMDLELRQLRSVVALADHLHFGRAALARHVSQPALTKQIRKIEETLEGPLFIRKPRQLALTRAGEVFVARARPLLQDAQLAGDLFRGAMRGEAGLLRIGFGIASLASGLPDLIQSFRGRFPGVQIAMRDMSTPAQLDALENRALDVGFVRVPVSRAELSASPLFRDRLVVAVGPNTRSSPREGLAFFSHAPFIAVARSASASLYDHVLRTCRSAGFTPRIAQEVGELFTVLTFVRAGAGVALVPDSARVLKVPRVRYVETGVPSAVFDIGIAFHKSATSDPVLNNFLSVVRQRYRSQVPMPRGPDGGRHRILSD